MPMTVSIVMRTSEWLIQTLFCLRMGVRLCRQLAYSILSRHIKNFQGDFISWSTLFCTYYLFGLYPTLLVFVQKATRQTYDSRKLYRYMYYKPLYSLLLHQYILYSADVHCPIHDEPQSRLVSERSFRVSQLCGPSGLFNTTLRRSNMKGPTFYELVIVRFAWGRRCRIRS